MDTTILSELSRYVILELIILKLIKFRQVRIRIELKIFEEAVQIHPFLTICTSPIKTAV